MDAVHSGIVVYDGGDIVFDAKRSNQWMQYTVDTVCSRIVVYDGEDIVFGAERSNQWMQYAVDAVEYRSGTVNSKLFIGKVLLRIKWKFELINAL